MQQYPYFAPQIMTDQTFLKYGGQTGTSTQAQRDAAYLLAEDQMTEHLSSFLLPTTITGTHFWLGRSPLELEFGHILRINRVTVNDVNWANSCSVNTSTGSCAQIRNAEYGYIDVNAVVSCGGCGAVVGYPPYNIQVVYESGLSTGTSFSPTMLSALSMAAQINLNEWDVSLANEGVADVGIQGFSNQSYSEQRKYLGRTVFGNSAMAQRVALLTKKYRSKPSLGFR